ncbi:MAG: hypothetical protein RMK01_05910 [Thermomicrobium sp.]|nr:hypothetical protein [Thermomicrobium sp.]MDW8059592.1 hypothetical protein [Thermomicrobium sp.]
MTDRRLYIWLDRDPFSGPPDLWIEDVPGRADLDLLAEAIRSGRLGRFLPTRLAISPHERPRLSTGFRSVNVPNLLRQYRIPYRTRLELLAVPASDDAVAPASPSGQDERCT